MNKVLKYIFPVIQYLVGSILLYYLLDSFGSAFWYSFIKISAYHEVYTVPFVLLTGGTMLITQLVAGLYLININHVFFRYSIFYLVWLFLSCIFCAILWSYYDMSAGYFPKGGLLCKKIMHDICRGVTEGCVMVVLMFPYNLSLLILSFFILKYNKVLQKGD